MEDSISSIIAGVIGSGLTAGAMLIARLYWTKKRYASDDLETRLKAAEKEREALFEDSQALRKELQTHILDLRREMLALQQEHIKCAVENAELRQKVIFLASEKEQLLDRVRHLESQVDRLTADRFNELEAEAKRRDLRLSALEDHHVLLQ